MNISIIENLVGKITQEKHTAFPIITVVSEHYNAKHLENLLQNTYLKHEKYIILFNHIKLLFDIDKCRTVHVIFCSLWWCSVCSYYWRWYRNTKVLNICFLLFVILSFIKIRIWENKILAAKVCHAAIMILIVR